MTTPNSSLITLNYYMTQLYFLRNADGRNEATFEAGSVNILQVKKAEPLPDQQDSLCIQARLSTDLPWTTVKVYVPCPDRVVSLSVQSGQVRLITDLDILAAGVTVSSGAGSGNLTPADVAALIEQVEQNRLAIEGQARINDEQQRQIDKNTEVNEQQQQDLEQEYSNEDVKKLWDQVMK